MARKRFTPEQIVPLFVPGSVTIDGACTLCGDFDCSNQVDITDAVYLINYIFAGGQAPRDPSEGDINCDGRTDISDAVRLICYLFALGNCPTPCDECPPIGFRKESAVGKANIWIEETAGSANGLSLMFSTDADVSGLEINLESATEPVFELVVPGSSVSSFSAYDGSLTKIGLIDLTGSGGIPAGEHELLRWQNTGLEMPVISEAIAADRNAQPIAVRILATAKSEALPREFAIKQNFPNPFNPTTQIAYDVPHAEQVRIDIYNVLGQRVVTVVDAPHQPGRYSITWNGTDESGRGVASGVYLYRITAGTFVESKKMMLLK